jgi:hypothetical protein
MADTTLNFCHLSGQLVGPSYPIPETPFDFVWDSGDACFGCNQLVDASGRKARAQIRGKVRVYSSREHSEPISGRRWIEDARLDDLGMTPPWHCGGHPRLSPPFVLDGEVIDHNADWHALVHGIIDNTRAVSRPEFANHHVMTWLQRLYHLVAHTPLSDPLASAVADVALDNALSSQLAGWLFYCYLPEASGVERLVEWAAEATLDDLGQRDKRLSPQTLGTLIQLVVAETLERCGDEPALSAARRLVLEQGKGAYRLVEALGSNDLPWVTEHTIDILKAHPTTLVLGPLIEVHRLEMGELLPLWLSDLFRNSKLDRQLFVMAINDSLRGNDRAQALAELPIE